MRVRAAFNALTRKRSCEGRWVYLVWLAGYVALAFVVVTYAAVLGQNYLSAFVFYLVPAVIGYIQFRFRTILGWAVLSVPTVVFAVIGGLLWAASGEWRLDGTIMILWLIVVSGGLVYYAPTRKK